jgi:hypothetical protein
MKLLYLRGWFNEVIVLESLDTALLNSQNWCGRRWRTGEGRCLLRFLNFEQLLKTLT